jgi:hypothetical protein
MVALLSHSGTVVAFFYSGFFCTDPLPQNIPRQTDNINNIKVETDAVFCCFFLSPTNVVSGPNWTGFTVYFSRFVHVTCTVH